MALYRSWFYNEESRIAIITGVRDQYIRQGYYGGSVELFEPRIVDGYMYDVTSMYPYCMLKDMPVGPPVSVMKGDLKKHFGFFRARVYVPECTNIPFLQVRIDKRPVCPVGKLEGVFFTEELVYAEQLGCVVTLYDGLAFERGRPFDEFVNNIFNKRVSATSESEKARCKLWLNSCYGKFAQHPERVTTETMSVEKFNKIGGIHAIDGFTMHEDDMVTVTYETAPDLALPGSANDFAAALIRADGTPDNVSNVAIAAAVTA